MTGKKDSRAETAVKDSQLPWAILCIVLALAILGVFFFALLPKLTAAPATASPENPAETGIDFSDSAWLDAYMAGTAGLYGMDFADESALSCGAETGMILYTYASGKSVEELRELYRTGLGADEYDRNDETALHLQAGTEQGKLTVTNTFSQVCRVLHLNLTLSPEELSRLSSELAAAFPETLLDSVTELSPLCSREVHGTSVRYVYDDMDGYFRKNAPIFSRAYPGSAAEWQELRDALTARYENHISDTGAEVCYFEINGGVLALGRAGSAAGEDLITVLLQPAA